jgi:hypothetical protein
MVCLDAFTKVKFLAKGYQIDAIDFNHSLTAKQKANRIKMLFSHGHDKCVNKVIDSDYKGEIEQEEEEERKLARIAKLKEKPE